LTFYKPQNTLPFHDTVTVRGGVQLHVNERNVNRQNQQHLRIDRKHSRIHADLPCKVGPSDSRVMAARVLDLSTGGLKFCCDRNTIQKIIPESQQALGLILGVEIVVHFTVKLQGKRTSAIKTQARVIHSERLAQDLFHVGIQFLDLEPTASTKLETFIRELMAAARAVPESPES
jgi:c-di-GMP-binding flagellar brake protein YcgR